MPPTLALGQASVAARPPPVSTPTAPHAVEALRPVEVELIRGDLAIQPEEVLHLVLERNSKYWTNWSKLEFQIRDENSLSLH